MPRKFYHFSPRINAASITRLGLRVDMHKGATPAIWLCGGRMLSWTLAHVRAKYQLPRTSLVCYQAILPSTWVFKVSRGLFLCYRDIPIDRLTMIAT